MHAEPAPVNVLNADLLQIANLLPSYKSLVILRDCIPNGFKLNIIGSG